MLPLFLFGLRATGNQDPQFRYDGETLEIFGEGIISRGFVTSIGAYNSIRHVLVQNNITIIDEKSFEGLENLESVELNSSCLLEARSSAYIRCPKLVSIKVHQGLNVIGYSTFRECSKLKEVFLAEGITVIGTYSFYLDQELEIINFPNSLLQILYNAFNGCVKINEIKFGQNLQIIGEGAFRSISFPSIYIPKNVEDIQACSLGLSDKFKFVSVDPENIYLSNDSQGILYSKNMTILKMVPSGLTNITIPNSVTTINYGSLTSCKLETLVIPDSISYIFKESFNNMRIRSLVIGSGIKEIPKGAFSNIQNLERITIKDGVEKICEEAFVSVLNIKYIFFGKSISIIEINAFPPLLPLETIEVEQGNSALEIQNGVLYQKTNGIRTSIPLITTMATVIEIGDHIINISMNGIGIKGLEYINVSDGNPKFSSFNSILYNKNLSEVIFIPKNISEIHLNSKTKIVNAKSGYECKATILELNYGLEEIQESAFYECPNIQEVLIPGAVGFLSPKCFQDCSKLSRIEINCLRGKIGDYAFFRCKIEKLIFSQDCGITEIGAAVFYGSQIKEVQFPKTIQILGTSAFSGSSVETIAFPEDSELRKIENSCFFGSKLKAVSIPKSVVQIITYAFANSTISSVSFGGNLTLIDSGAFKYSKLATISFSESSSPLKISDDAFLGTSVKNLVMPGNIISIGESAFRGCLNLETVTIAKKNNLASLSSYAFADCSSLTSIDLGLESKITQLRPALFSGCNSLQSFVIPQSVNQIGSQVFHRCWKLRTITIGVNSQLTEIGEIAFDGCMSLERIFVPKGVKSIRSKAFNGCSSLGELTFDNRSVSLSIETNAFFGCMSLPRVDFPTGLQAIGSKAFETCQSLSSITFAEGCGLSVIQEDTFFGCVRLSRLDIPQSVRVISKGAFNGCARLEEIRFENGSSLEDIESSAFTGCDMLRTVDFGADSRLRSIGAGAFSGCFSIEGIAFPPSLEAVAERSFSGCSGLKRVEFGVNSALKAIKGLIFEGCQMLKSITLPPSVEVVEGSGFEGSSLTSIVFEGGILAKLRTLRANSFRNVVSLETLRLPGSLSAIEPDALLGCTSLVNISFDVTIVIAAGLPLIETDRKVTYRASRDSRSILTADGSVLVACPSARGTYEMETTVVEIAPRAFRLTRLSSANVGKISVFGEGCFEGTSLERANISSARVINARAFADCPNLMIKLDESVLPFERVEEEAFRGSPSAFESIKFGNRLEYIGSNAFDGVRSLSDVTYCGVKDFSRESACSRAAFGDSFNSEDVNLKKRTNVGEDYEWLTFCGVEVRRKEGNPCVIPTIERNISFNKQLIFTNIMSDDE